METWLHQKKGKKKGLEFSHKRMPAANAKDKRGGGPTKKKGTNLIA